MWDPVYSGSSSTAFISSAVASSIWPRRAEQHAELIMRLRESRVVPKCLPEQCLGLVHVAPCAQQLSQIERRPAVWCARAGSARPLSGIESLPGRSDSQSF